ncbi:MAG: D-ribose ABC transporter substrate-binding protein, partial [Psychromonas sp.]
VQASGKNNIILGFDGTDDGIAAVKRGLLGATIAQQPALIGEIGVQSAVDKLAGKSVAENIPVPLMMVVK